MCESRRIVKNRQSKTTTLQSMIENSAKKGCYVSLETENYIIQEEID